jgi:hypothetical protein
MIQRPDAQITESRRAQRPGVWLQPSRFVLALALVMGPALASAQNLPRLLLEPEEIALARSAAPPELSAAAAVYVLRRGGHVKVVAGTNGAACMVARDHPESLYPICYDPEAARTMLPVELEENRLRERGLSEDSIIARIDAGFRNGQFSPPSTLAIAYMMSRQQVLYAGANGRRVGQWFPHLMYYAPYMTREKMANGGMPNGDMTLAQEGRATAHFVVMTRDWAPSPPAPAATSPALGLQPGWACPGDTVVLRFGSETTSMIARTTEEIRRTRADGSVALDTLSIHPAEMVHELRRPSATCAGRLSLTSMAIPPARASDRIKPRSVTNHGAHPVLITHRGITVRLAPGESTDRFNTVPFSGDWGVIVETGEYNGFCPVPSNTPGVSGPPIHIRIVTGCAAENTAPLPGRPPT